MKTHIFLPVFCLSFLLLAFGSGVARAQSGDPQPFPPEAMAVTDDAGNHLPRVVSRVDADYPAGLKGSGKEDVVFVVFVVTAQGEVTRARVAFGQIPECEQAAMAALAQWKFNPGVHRGRPVNTRMFVQFGFRETKP